MAFMSYSKILFPCINRLAMMCVHLAFFFTLLLGYEYYIVPLYGYSGFVFAPNNIKFIPALCFLLIISFVTPIDQKKPSTLFLHITLMFVLIPMLVLFYAADNPWLYILQTNTAYIVLIIVVSILKFKSLRLPSLDDYKLLNILMSISVLYIGIIFLLGGGSYFNLDISRVYDFRTDSSENLPEIFSYISSMVSKSILPFAFLLALTEKKYIFALLSFGLSILAFGLTAHKSTLFYPFFVFFIYIILSSKNLIRYFSLSMLFILILSCSDFWLSEILVKTPGDSLYGWFGSLMMRRMFIVPADLNYIYYDFFSNNDWVFWSESKVTFGLLNYPYELDVPHLIGSEYFGSEEMGANTGWMGSGYMQAGFFGILLYALIIAVIFKFIDEVAITIKDRKLVTVGTLVPIFSLITSSDLPTVFVTHGLFLNLILITLLKTKDLKG